MGASRRHPSWILITVVVLSSLIAACDGSSGPPTTLPQPGTPAPTSTVTTTMRSGASAPTSTSTEPATTSTRPPIGPIVRLPFSVANGDCADVVFVDRVILPGSDPLVSSFEMLVAGPTPDEKKDGARSWFSDETAGTVRSVEFDDGRLVVDFDNFMETISNAGTSCGSESLLAQLNGTAFQFADVDEVTYGIEGNCETFFNWLQRDCREYHRP